MNGIMKPWDKPIADRKAMFPVDGIGTTNHNRRNKLINEVN